MLMGLWLSICLNRKLLLQLLVTTLKLCSYHIWSIRSTSEVRFGVVWDRYIEGSPRSSTREKCGSGSWIIVKSTMPKNWKSFLRFDENTNICLTKPVSV